MSRAARRASATLVVLGVLMIAPGPTSASTMVDPGPDTDCVKRKYNPCGRATGGDFTVGVSVPARPARGRGPARPGAAAPVSRPTRVRETAYEPTCSANRPDNGGGLCGQALGACPGGNEVAYWVFTRTRNTVTGAVSAWDRVNTPPYVCQGPGGPAAAAVPVEALIGAQLAREFASLPLPRGQVQVRPRAQTLLNVETHVFTTTTTQALPARTILGRSVTVLAEAERYDWHLGDGTTYRDAGPGSEAAPVRHVYRAAGWVGPYVSITWSGTFRIAGDPATYPIVGTAATDGPPADLTVRTARSELVARS